MNFRNLVKDGTFIADWMDRNARLETAHQYDFWSALWLLSFIVGRRAHVPRPLTPLYLNMLILFVSESGVGRKSTSITLATNLAQKLVDLEIVSPTLLSGSTTSEQFDEVLHKLSTERGSAEVGIAISEMARFLGRTAATRSLPITITDLYDCPDKRVIFGTKKEGEKLVLNAWVSLITGCAPEWLEKAVHPAVLEGGFAGRTLFITADRNKGQFAWPEGLDDLTLFIDHAKRITEELAYDSKITIDPGGLAEYNSWHTHRTGAKSKYERIFESREQDHVLRLAALLSINDNRYVIRNYDITSAIKCIGEIKHGISNLFIEGTPREKKLTNGIELTRRILAEARPELVAHNDLYRRARVHLNKNEFRALINALNALGMIEVKKMATSKGLFYRATAHIHGAGRLQELVQSVKRMDVW